MDKTLKVEARGEREIVMTRGFAAPRKLVFEAFIKPDLVRQWLLGPEGWTMPVCEIDARAGGKYRYVWKRGDTEMGMGGVYREVVPPQKIVATEKFDEAWYPGEAVVTTTFTEAGDRTQVVMTVLYDSREARDMALKSGMESGVAVSYDRLEKMVTAAAVKTAYPI